MAIACVRAFVQLMAIGYVIHLIFSTEQRRSTSLLMVVGHAGLRRRHVGPPRPRACPAR